MKRVFNKTVMSVHLVVGVLAPLTLARVTHAQASPTTAINTNPCTSAGEASAERAVCDEYSKGNLRPAYRLASDCVKTSGGSNLNCVRLRQELKVRRIDFVLMAPRPLNRQDTTISVADMTGRLRLTLPQGVGAPDPIPLEPGEYNVALAAPGHQATTLELGIAERPDEISIVWLRLPEPPTTTVGTSTPSRALFDAQPAAQPIRSSRWIRWWPSLASGAGAAASLGYFLIERANASNAQARYNRNCSASSSGTCDAFRDDLQTSARDRGRADVAGALSVLAGGAFVCFVAAAVF